MKLWRNLPIARMEKSSYGTSKTFLIYNGTYHLAPASEYKYEWNLSETIIKTFHRIKQNMSSSTAAFSSTHWKYFRLVLLFIVSLSAVSATTQKDNSGPEVTKTPPAAVPLFDGKVILEKKGGLLAQKDVKFSYHTEPHLKAEGPDIRIKLDTPGVDFLYLDADPKIVEYLKLREQNGDAKTFGNIGDRLLHILGNAYPGPSIRIEPTPISGRLNYNVWDYKDSGPVGVFHRDGVSPGHTLLNVWIALEDVTARPLAFMKTHGKDFPSSESGVDMPFDSDGDYVVVKEMKKGEMLLFYANEIPHGMLIELNADKPYGPRNSVTFAYGLQR
jgi:hypothetical protein